MSWGKLCIIFMRKYYVQCRHVMRKSCSLKLCLNCIKFLKKKNAYLSFSLYLEKYYQFHIYKIGTIIGVRWCNLTFIPKDHKTVIMNCYIVMPESILMIFWCIIGSFLNYCIYNLPLKCSRTSQWHFFFDNVRC